MSIFQFKSLSERILLWVLVGPVFLLATLCVGLVKAPGALGMIIPLAVMIGVFCCWKWQAKGLIGSLVLLTIAAYSFEASTFPGSNWWFTGMVAALACGLFITSLSFHEVFFIVRKTEEDAARYLEDYLRIEEKLKEQDATFEKERGAFRDRYGEAEAYVGSLKEELVSTRNTLTLVKGEVDELNKRELELKSKLLLSREGAVKTNDLQVEKEPINSGPLQGELKATVKREAIAKVSAGTKVSAQGLSQAVMVKVLMSSPVAYRLPALQGRVASLIASKQNAGKWITTKEKVRRFQKGKDVFSKEISVPMLKQWAKEVLAKEKQQFLETDLVQKTEEVQKVWEELSSLKKDKESLEDNLREAFSEKAEMQDRLKELEQIAEEIEEWKSQAKQCVTELNRMKDGDTSTASTEGSQELKLFHKMTGYLGDEVKRLKRNNDLYKQLRKQFEDKTEVLDRTREEMFQMETQLLAKEMQEEEQKRSNSRQVAGLEREIASLIEDQDQLENELDSLKEVLSSLLSS